MKRSWVTYVCLGLVAVAAFVGTRIGGDDLVHSVAGVALFGTLAGFVVQLIRDDAAYKREIEKADRAEERAQSAADRAEERKLVAQEHETRFTLGVSSHMAKVAFDKHVAFCEEYAAVADNALGEIFQQGATENALYLASQLGAIRRKHVVWLTKGIDEKLRQFEDLFSEMGASAGYLRATQGANDERQAHLKSMQQRLMTLTGASVWDGEKLNQEMAVVSTIRWLRQVLGTEELNTMRRLFIERAVAEMDMRGEKAEH